MLLYAGIDEAGYGPMLGPLCVGMTVFEVSGWSPGEPAPDLWNLLSPVACRTLKDWRKDPRGRIPIADSKALKLSNQSKTRHPLLHLERAVLALLGAGLEAWPEHDEGLFLALGIPPEAFGGGAWYSGARQAMPQGSSRAELHIAGNLLHGALARAGVAVHAVRCEVVSEGAFNETVRRTGTKASATALAISRHIAWLRDWAERERPGAPLRLVCDRLGGRTKYAGMVGRCVPGLEVEAVEELPERSRYRVGAEGGLDWAFSFQPEGETKHLPVAAASVVAKLVRELAMARLNRHFAARAPELKPTAGYVSDARRWLQDAGGVLRPGEREALVRIA